MTCIRVRTRSSGAQTVELITPLERPAINELYASFRSRVSPFIDGALLLHIDDEFISVVLCIEDISF